MEQKYTYTNESFSGCDMVATIMMKKPNTDNGKIVYSIGELQTISYSIHIDKRPVRSIGNINAKDYVMGQRTIAGSLVFTVFNKHFAKKILNEIDNATNSNYEFLMDELPPFDIILTFANEFGLRSKIVIYGVRLINEGQVMSVNDVYTENTYQFVATDLEYLNDDNSYVNVSPNGYNKYIIQSNNDMNSRNLNFEDVPSQISTASDSENLSTTEYRKAELSCTVIKNEDQHNLGCVEFKLNSPFDDGYINIEGPNNYSINISKLSNKKTINLYVKSGDYIAKWSNDDYSSNEINISVKYIPISLKPDDSAPLIENITGYGFHATRNVASHNTLICKTETDSEVIQVDFKNNRTIHIPIENDKTYKIYTLNKDDTNSKSKMVNVKPSSVDEDLFEELLEYLSFNKKCLINKDFEFYEVVIRAAKELNSKNIHQPISIADTFIKLEEEYIKIIKTSTNQSEIDNLNNLIKTTEEIIIIINSLTSDKVYNYNKDTIAITPPRLDLSDFSNNILLVNDNIERIHFYKKIKNTQKIQYVKTIEKYNFVKRNNSEYECKFTGKNGEYYYAYAEDVFGSLSQRVDIYITSDTMKSEYINKNKQSKDNTDYQFKKAENLLITDDMNDLSDQDKNILKIEITKTKGGIELNNVLIEPINKHSFNVNVNNNLKLLTENKCRLVLCRYEEAIKDTPKYKIPINSNLINISNKYGINPNEVYTIWIENENEEQVCNCISYNTINDLTKIDSYYKSSILNEYKEYMISRKVNKDIVNNIYNSIFFDENSKRYNILHNILNFVKSDYDLLYLTMTFIYEKNKYLKYITDRQIVYSLNERKLYINNQELINSYKLSILKFADKIEEEIIEVNQNYFDTSNYKDKFIIISFISNDILKRSGFIIIDTLLNICKSYKMNFLIKAGVNDDSSR